MTDLNKQNPIKNLETLLQNMEPVLGSVCAFCQVDEETYKNFPAHPIAMFREEEGITLVLNLEEAQSLNLPIVWIGTQITLNVHSSLDAVGFLARITTALADENISVNAFSPVSHDHIFIKPEDAEHAMEILRGISRARFV